ncbi:hypothetical protein D3874_12325 [Oleomonas cavernae]|uniref:MobA/MobL protein domain-containing protein n=1 Tax=Oleomonas cavernae TaxID=2320859 RepID=A0A418WCJ3_9PROT|nr:MobA/MobL family protein [Oleomonas cavernae]RJF87710.1 hypothetical protein D3874_12325 [Oleomonas cavernae]
MGEGHFRLSLQKLHRAGGRGRLQQGARVCHSLVAMAAYRSGSRLHDLEVGEIEDYRRRQRGVVDAEILLPETAPAWACDREKLWNAVAQVEKRRGAVLGYEFVLSLPHEIGENSDASRDLVRGWVKTNLVDRHGVAADVAWHRPGHEGDDRNWHCHVMVSDRKFAGQAWATKQGSRADGELGSTGELRRWRLSWAESCNQALVKIGSPTRVDHRSRRDRGLPAETAQLREGKARHMARRGVESDRDRQVTARLRAIRLGSSLSALTSALVSESQGQPLAEYRVGQDIARTIAAAIIPKKIEPPNTVFRGGHEPDERAMVNARLEQRRRDDLARRQAARGLRAKKPTTHGPRGRVR